MFLMELDSLRNLFKYQTNVNPLQVQFTKELDELQQALHFKCPKRILQFLDKLLTKMYFLC